MIEVIYILAKNESANISRCLDAMADLPTPVVLLDSGSQDDTVAIARRYANVEVREWDYRSHCSSYNRLTEAHTPDAAVMVLDADMRIDGALLDQANRAFSDPAVEAVIAPVTMFWAGHELVHGHMYPPKPIAFRGGRAYFEPVGHGERLRSGVRATTIEAHLVHDDRKPQAAELAKQWRYAQQLASRAKQGSLTWRDRLRADTPLMVGLIPLYAYTVKRGFMNGRAGLIYCLDRLVAEALNYRAVLLRDLDAETGVDETPDDAFAEDR